MKCRIDKSNCKIFLNFGKMPIANGFLKKQNFKNEYFFNLSVGFNKKLSLFQLKNNPHPKKMFNKNYPFYTSSSKYMVKHFSKFALWIKSKFKIGKKLKILEIGSNDGTFLNNFKNYLHVGIEPSQSVHKVALANKINSKNKFFDETSINEYMKKNILFDVIVGSNVICHIPNQVKLISNVKKILKDDGMFIFEEPYLGAMYKKVSYDQIYDEHIYMFSASSISKIYNKYGMSLVDAIPQKTHGGSMRYIIKKNKSLKVSKRLKRILKEERKKNIDNYKGCIKFKKQVEESKKKLRQKIFKIKMKKQKICGYGATSKSTTILNYCGINHNYIDCIFDTTPYKIGKYSPGTHIPILNYKYFRREKYKNVFLFAWNHKQEIMKKEKKLKHINWFSHLN